MHGWKKTWSQFHPVRFIIFILDDSSEVYQLPGLDSDILPNNINAKTRKVFDLVQKKAVL